MEIIKKYKIYKLSSKNHQKYYIGSTCVSLAQRLALHKYNKTHSKFKCSSFDIIDDDAIIELLEELPEQMTKYEVLKKEAEYIKLHGGSIVNKNIPARSVKEWYNDNKDRVLEGKKTYYIDNKNDILNKRRAYYEANKATIIGKIKAYQQKIKNQ